MAEKVTAQPVPEAVNTLPVHDAKDDITMTLAKDKSDSDFDHLEEGNSGKYEEYYNAGLNEEEARFLSSFSPAEEKKIFRKVDFRVVPMLAMLVSFTPP